MGAHFLVKIYRAPASCTMPFLLLDPQHFVISSEYRVVWGTPLLKKYVGAHLSWKLAMHRQYVRYLFSLRSPTSCVRHPIFQKRYAQGPYCAQIENSCFCVFNIILQTIKNVQEPGRFPCIVIRQGEPGRSPHGSPYFSQRPPASTPHLNI